MLSRTSHLLFKRLASSHLPKTKSLPFQYFPKEGHSQTPIFSFSSSFQQNPRRTEYREEDLFLLKNKPDPNYLQEAKEFMEKYAMCQDLSLLTQDEVTRISILLFNLAIAHNSSRNIEKAHKYLKEEEDLLKKAGNIDTFRLASNFFFQADLYLRQQNLTKAKHYLDGTERICLLLGDDRQAKGLMLQCKCSLAHIYERNDGEKALSLLKSVLEGIGDAGEAVLPSILTSAYQGIGRIYYSRRDIEKTVECLTKGLEAATKYYGQDSKKAFQFYDQIVELLKRDNQASRALDYAQKSLQVALKIFSKDSVEIASNYSRLGYLYAQTGNNTKALESYGKAIKIYENSPQESSIILCDLYFQTAIISVLQDNSQEASDFLTKANQSAARAYNGIELAHIYLAWAQKFKDLGRMVEEANFYLWKALEIYQRCKPEDYLSILDIYYHLGYLAFAQRDWIKACEHFKKCEIYFERAQINISLVKKIYSYLASASIQSGDLDGGLKYAQKVIKCYEASGDPNNVGDTYHNIGAIYQGKGMLKEALEAFKKSLEFPDNQTRLQASQHEISVIENELKIASEENEKISGKISQVLKTFKAPEK